MVGESSGMSLSGCILARAILYLCTIYVWICGLLTKIAKTAEVRCALDMITSGQLPCTVAITPHNPLHVCMHAHGWMDGWM